ncbi:DUF3885 domain-containing protein [Paenibacillus frigoriresistens]|uniref:DUF3885 domain-containing protein n=1 Tax=Paenibacillus alginolyticus TaxID=59839 RepID=UPI001565B04D|nr:DUF3885 domain-containing protein [Paenibacillus frigoriresistens]NRF89857.1 DUF3885 domain-containing protein [Paenibacillus frigoriresistens]
MILDDYLHMNFPDLKMCPPLFYNWEYGIRFELGNPPMFKLDKTSYMQQVYDRAISIYRYLHKDNDEIFIVTNAHFADKPNPIRRKPKVYRRYINNKNVLQGLHHKLSPYVFADVYEIDDFETHRFILKCHGRNIKYGSLIRAICNNDVAIKPSIYHDVFFVNISAGTIFHVYDDRGCDVVASTKEALNNIYRDYNEWILNYDRSRIDQQFVSLDDF